MRVRVDRNVQLGDVHLRRGAEVPPAVLAQYGEKLAAIGAIPKDAVSSQTDNRPRDIPSDPPVSEEADEQADEKQDKSFFKANKKSHRRN